MAWLYSLTSGKIWGSQVTDCNYKLLTVSDFPLVHISLQQYIPAPLKILLSDIVSEGIILLSLAVQGSSHVTFTLSLTPSYKILVIFFSKFILCPVLLFEVNNLIVHWEVETDTEKRIWEWGKLLDLHTHPGKALIIMVLNVVPEDSVMKKRGPSYSSTPTHPSPPSSQKAINLMWKSWKRQETFFLQSREIKYVLIY